MVTRASEKTGAIELNQNGWQNDLHENKVFASVCLSSSIGLVVRTGDNSAYFFSTYRVTDELFWTGEGRRRGGGELGKFTGINSRVPYVKRLIPLI